MGQRAALAAGAEFERDALMDMDHQPLHGQPMYIMPPSHSSLPMPSVQEPGLGPGQWIDVR